MHQSSLIIFDYIILILLLIIMLYSGAVCSEKNY